MNVLLIAPPLYIIRRHKRIFPRYPPYLLLSVAAQLEHAGFNVKAYDAFFENAVLEDIKEAVKRYNPALIGIAPADIIRYLPLDVIIALIKFIKANFPDIPIAVFGLKYKNVIDNLIKNTPEADYMLLGDPEEIMVELALCLERDGKTGNISGIITKEIFNDGFCNVSPRIIDNLDRLFSPSWHLIDLKRYYLSPHRHKRSKIYPITATRGCPWNRCAFCKDPSIFNAFSYRSRSPENVVSEMVFAEKKYGNIEIQFFDSNFNTDLEWLTGFQKEIDRRKIHLPWSCLSRVDRLNKEKIKIMRNTGCWNIVFGIETVSQRLLDTIDKGSTIEQISGTAQLCKEAGIEITGNFLLGLPSEEPQDVADSARFAVSAGFDYAAFFIAKWHNGGMVPESSGSLLKEWDYPQFDFIGPVFVPKSYKGLNHLKKTQRGAYLFFYLHPRTIIKHIKKINTLYDLRRLCRAFLTLLKINIWNVSKK